MSQAPPQPKALERARRLVNQGPGPARRDAGPARRMLRALALRLIRPYSAHQQQVDAALLDALAPAAELEAVNGLPGLGEERSSWFWQHYDQAASETIAFLREAGVSLAGARVADVGCGDGIIDLGIMAKAAPCELVGFDINPVDPNRLLDEARREGIADSLPPGLRFVVSDTARIPADDDAFDVVVSWSAFEHIADPPALMHEIRRIMRPDGVFFLQLWPFYWSEHGSHLWRWFPEGFAQLRSTPEEIEETVRADGESDRGLIDMMLREYGTLNQATLDDLGASITRAGMRVTRIEPIAGAAHLPIEAAGLPLSKLVISGVKLAAVPHDP